MPYGLLRSLPQPIRPQSKILIDFITSLPEYKDLASRPNFDSILIVINRYTKMAQYIACYKTVNALELAKILQEKVFSIFRTLDGIMSNCRTMFTSQFWLAFCYYLMCKRWLSTAYYPQTNGQTERQNQNLKHYLQSYCNLNNNNQFNKLTFTEFTYNNSKHQVLQDTPF